LNFEGSAGELWILIDTFSMDVNASEMLWWGLVGLPAQIAISLLPIICEFRVQINIGLTARTPERLNFGLTISPQID